MEVSNTAYCRCLPSRKGGFGFGFKNDKAEIQSQVAWNEYKKRMIDEKLARLGIDGAFGGNNVANTLPHIHAPHARAASVRIALGVPRLHYLTSAEDILTCRPCPAYVQVK